MKRLPRGPRRVDGVAFFNSQEAAIRYGLEMAGRQPHVGWCENRVGPGRWRLLCQDTRTGRRFTVNAPRERDAR